MSLFLRLFETTSEYETYINGDDAVLPNVSFCEDERGMHYNPWTPPKNVIIYEATAKLTETTTDTTAGLHINRFRGASGPLTMENHTFENGVGTVTFNGNITIIGVFAFYKCSELTSVTIPNSVTSIEQNAFTRCSGLTSIEIPNSVTSIEMGPFQHCSGLTSVTIPNSVTSIGNYAFQNCSELTSVTIGSDVTSIGERAFYGCSNLTHITWNAKKCTDFSSSSNAPFYDIRTQIIEFKFGEEVETIPSYLCCGVTRLTSVTIPDSVTSIGSSTFEDCSSLTSVTIPNSVTSIGSDAFYECENIGDIYCYPNPNDLEIKDSWDDDFKEDKQTVCHVKSEYLSQYEEHFGEANVTFVGDLV